MKVSREEAAASQKGIFDVASRLYPGEGFDGVADLVKGGMTRCGFYRHFESIDPSAPEACERAMVPTPNGRCLRESQVATRLSAYLSEERMRIHDSCRANHRLADAPRRPSAPVASWKIRSNLERLLGELTRPCDIYRKRALVLGFRIIVLNRDHPAHAVFGLSCRSV
jgi:hypothetical protein